MFKYLTSTIIIKIVMALTGLACVGFLFGHAAGNLQYFLGPDTYNSYAYFLQSLGEILWIIRFGLIGCILLHIISAVYLRIHNNAAKPIGYQVKNYVKAKLTSRVMLWTGLLICSALTFHLLHFTVGAIDFEDGYNNEEIHPTGTFVFGMTGCSETDAQQCKMDNARQRFECPDCDRGETCQMVSNSCASCPQVDANKPCQTSASCEHCDARECDFDSVCPDISACKQVGDQCTSPDEHNAMRDAKCGTKECQTEGNCSKNSSAECCNSNFNTYEEPRQGEVVKPRHDVYAMVTAEFSNVFVALAYIIFVSLVGFHLNHAIQSAIHTIGIEGPKFTPFMRIASTCLSIILVLLFISLPLGVLAKTYLGCIVGGLF